jgi:hypothetical protein
MSAERQEIGRYSDDYIDRLLVRSDYEAMVELSGIFFSWTGRDLLQADYRLPSPVFVYVEALCWFAQAWRSGVWTYYDATPVVRQEAMREALRIWAPLGYAERYGFGMIHWNDERRIQVLDEWMRKNEKFCNEWLAELLRKHRQELRPLYT